MTAEPDLNSRVDVIEDHLVENYRARRLVGFPPLYAALAVAAVVLIWFPAYNPVDRGDGDVYVHQPLILAPMGLGFITFLFAAPLVSAMVIAMMKPDRDHLAPPIVAAILGALGAILLLSRFAAVGDPGLTGTGRAAVCVLFAATFTGIGHAVTVRRLRQPEAR